MPKIEVFLMEYTKLLADGWTTAYSGQFYPLARDVEIYHNRISNLPNCERLREDAFELLCSLEHIISLLKMRPL